MSFLGFGKKTTASTPEAQEAPELDPQAKIDQMLNNRKFVEYLQAWSEAKGKSVEDIAVAESGAEEMEREYKNFEKIAAITEKVRGVLKTEIAAAAKVTLGNEELSCVDKYLNEKGIREGAESLSQIEAEVDRFIIQKENVAKLSSEIKERSKNYVQVEGETIHKKEAGLRVASQVSRFKRVTGWFLKPQEAKDLQYADAAGVNTKHLRRTQAQVNREVTADGLQQKNLEAQQSAIKDIRFALIESFNESTDLVKLINAEVAKKLAGVVEAGSVNDLDAARRTYGEIDERFAEDLGDEWKNGLDKALEDKIGAQIRETMGALGENTNLSAMEGRLNKFFERRTKGFGFKEDEDIVQFIGKTFSDIYRTPNQLDFSKKLLLRRVCSKNGINLDDYDLSTALPEPEIELEPTDAKTREDKADRMDLETAQAEAKNIAGLAQTNGRASSEEYTMANDAIDRDKESGRMKLEEAQADAANVSAEAKKFSEGRRIFTEDKTPGIIGKDYETANQYVEINKKEADNPEPNTEEEPPASSEAA